MAPPAKVLLFFAALVAVTVSLSALEKAFRHRSSQRTLAVHLPHSLPVLKIVRLIILAMAATEASIWPLWSWPTFAVGLTAVFAGMGLRLAAIRSLGPLWSYHVQILPEHKVVRTGIYRYLRHPAYIGNIHIPGMLLLIGSPVSATLATACVALFYIVRSRAEDRMLSHIGGQ